MAAKRKPASRSKKTSSTAWLVPALGVLCAHLVRALPLLFLFGTVAYGSVRLWQHALQDPAYQLQPSLTLGTESTIPAEAQHAYQQLAAGMAGRSLLHPHLLRDLQRDYEACVWVRSVHRMERVFPNQVAIEFVPRLPVAQVWHRGYYWLVDEEGLMLPIQGLRKPRAELPVIAGVVRDRPADGQAWRDPGVRGALGVMEALSASAIREDLPVAKIQILRTSYLDALQQQRESRPRFELQTRDGVRILWGTYNEGELPDEILTSEKIATLRKLLARGIPLQPGLSVDIRTREVGYSLPQTHSRAR